MGEVGRVMVTGGSGFLGPALARALVARGLEVRLASRRRDPAAQVAGACWAPLPDLAGPVDWRPLLEGMDAVVHLAGLAHHLDAADPGLVGAYDRINHGATRQLAAALRDHPTVRRFLFASSITVHGRPRPEALREDSPLDPRTPYARSKVAAEAAIRELLGPAGPAWAIFRPALVYGPGAKGNWARLERMVRLGLPVPAGPRPNRRSFLGLDNFVSAAEAWLTAAQPPRGRTWLVADAEPVSTRRLLEALAEVQGGRARVVACPEPLLAWAARLGDGMRRLGLPSPWTSEVRDKLLGDFWADTGAIQAELGWRPPYGLEAALRRGCGG